MVRELVWTSGWAPVSGSFIDWRWLLSEHTSVPLTYTNWAPGEPNIASEQCLTLSRLDNYAWHNMNCENDIQCYICECEVFWCNLRYCMITIMKHNISSVSVLVHSLVTSLSDYCNAMLHRVPACSIKTLQRVQTVTARVVALCLRTYHIEHILEEQMSNIGMQQPSVITYGH